MGDKMAGWLDGQMGRWIHLVVHWLDGYGWWCTVMGWIVEWVMDGWMRGLDDEWLVGWMDVWKDGWTDE